MLKKKIITINGTEAINSKQTGEIIGINILEKQGEKDIKYTMWLTRKAKDGEDQSQRYPSAAAKAYKEQRLGIGSQCGVAYNEEEREYQYDDKKTGEKKTGKAINRTVAFFATPEQMESFNEVQTIDTTLQNSASTAPEGTEFVTTSTDPEINVEDIPF